MFYSYAKKNSECKLFSTWNTTWQCNVTYFKKTVPIISDVLFDHLSMNKPSRILDLGNNQRIKSRKFSGSNKISVFQHHLVHHRRKWKSWDAEDLEELRQYQSRRAERHRHWDHYGPPHKCMYLHMLLIDINIVTLK